jgi:hypothetical protein
MSAKAEKKTSRCWPGYEPVPGKSEHAEGSCRKKPARKKQIARGGKRERRSVSKNKKAA